VPNPKIVAGIRNLKNATTSATNAAAATTSAMNNMSAAASQAQASMKELAQKYNGMKATMIIEDDPIIREPITQEELEGWGMF